MSRLEEIIGVVNSQSHSIRKLSHNDLNWLIAQTQKAKELQAKVDELDKQITRHKKEKYECMKKKQRYKQALEFYADRFKYHEMLDQSGVLTVIEDDCGFTAREALKGVEGCERD